MTPDDLSKPLGLPKERAPSRRGLYLGAAAVVAVLAAGLAGWWFIGPTHGPTATAVIGASPPAVALTDTTASTTSSAPTTGGLTEVTPDGALTDTSGGAVVIHDPSAPSPIVLSALPLPGLIQKTADGNLPRVAADGTRPLDAYARPANVSGNSRIAIVIGGFGIDPDATTQAIGALPGPVTLAFAPYGKGLPKLVSEARAAGHELLLQIPLEPYNYPETDPGPNTLTLDATKSVNLDRLHWFLGRITNYIGVVNYMGARFTGDGDALTPVMADIGARGLLYLDDGSSPQSKAAAIAGTSTPFLQADLVLDADLSPAAIDARLDQLQAIARQRGYAIGTATAFPASIDRIAAFVNAAAAKGIDIVPLSALAGNRS